MAKVINFGSLNFDFVYSVDHTVAPGETLSSSKRECFYGGKGANQSLAIARAGVKEIFHAGCVGESDGLEMKEYLTGENVDTSLIFTAESASGHAVIQLDKNGQNSILLFGGANMQISDKMISDVMAFTAPGDILVLQNEINKLGKIIDSAHAAGLEIIFNFAPFDAAAATALPLEKISTLVVNETEGEGLTGEHEPEKIVDLLVKRMPRSRIILTLGKAGLIAFDGVKKIVVTAYPAEVVDTTAAGDTFLGYFIASELGGKSFEEALHIGSMASSIAVSRLGAAKSIPSKAEFENKFGIKL